MGLFGGASSTSVSSSDEGKKMTVYVTVGEQNLSCEVRRGDRVSDLKTALHYQQPALHVNQLQLSYKDTVLKDGEYLKEYGIKNRSRVMTKGPVHAGHGAH